MREQYLAAWIERSADAIVHTLDGKGGHPMMFPVLSGDVYRERLAAAIRARLPHATVETGPALAGSLPGIKVSNYRVDADTPVVVEGRNG